MAITLNGKASITNLTVGSSADLASIINDESGTGVLAFTNTPTFTTPILGTASATAIELGHATDTTLARVSAGVVSIEGVNVVTTSSTDTLTNKTLTSPVITGAVFNDGSVVFEGATANDFETTLTVTDPTADRTITFPDSTGTVALTSDITVTASSTNTFTNKSISLATNTVTASLAELNTAISDADVASLAGSETLTNKTLTSPTVNFAILDEPVLISPEERTTISATAAGSTVQFDVKTQGVLYYTSNSTGNWTLNVRGDGSTTLDSLMTTGDALTVVFLATNGVTPYYATAFQVDGNAITPKFQNGVAFSAGNASSIDIYTYTIIKTASATFTVLAGQTKFA